MAYFSGFTTISTRVRRIPNSAPCSTHEHLRVELEKVKPDWVQCDCKGHPGYTSWPTEVGSTSPGVVKDSLRIYRDVSRELGIPLIAHYSGVIDIRAVELHPDWGRVSADGSESKGWHSHGSTCSLGPYTDELMIPQMLEVIDKYDVDGFWVDGDCWGAKFCYCDRCKHAFTQQTGVTNIPLEPTQPHWREWAAFHRHSFEEHVRRYTEAVKARKPECTVCSNWMYSVCHPSQVSVPVDYISGDFSPVWALPNASLESRFIASRGMNWDLMAWGFLTMEKEMGGWTFKGAAQICQEAAVVISQGGAVSIYDQPDRNGLLTGWHHDIMADVADFVRARKQWVRGTQSVPQVAIPHSASHYYAANGEFLMECWSPARQPLEGALDCLLDCHCQVDVLAQDNLIANISDYALVVVAEQTNPSAQLLSALSDYVQAGGRVLISGTNAATDFGNLTGTIADGDSRDGHFYIEVDGQSTTIKGPWQPVTLNGARTWLHVLKHADPSPKKAARFGRESHVLERDVFLSDMTGQPPLGAKHSETPAITLNRIGKGVVAGIHSQYFTHYAQTHYPRSRKLVSNLISALSPGFIVGVDAPAKLHIVLRRQGTSTIVHLLNTGSSNPMSPSQGMVEEVDPIENVRLEIKRPGRPSRVYLAPSIEGLTWEWADDGLLVAHVRSVGIMESVVIES